MNTFGSMSYRFTKTEGGGVSVGPLHKQASVILFLTVHQTDSKAATSQTNAM